MKATDWIQVVTGVAVIVGLVLVVLELRQSRELAKLQLTSTGFEMLANQRLAMMGEDAAQVWGKACDSPDQFTKADFRVLESYFSEVLNRIRVSFRYSELSTLYDDEEWLRWQTNFYLIFSTYPGRVWWQNQTWVEAEIRQVGDLVFEEIRNNPPSCSENYDTQINAIKEAMAAVQSGEVL